MEIIKNNKAFTLMQLIVGVAVILILAASVLLIQNPPSRQGTAKDVRRSQDVIALGKAVELYQNDNDALPSDLASAVTIDAGEKYVLCSSASSLTCDGQTLDCLVINDVDFLSGYLTGALPVDPEKTDTSDTGYYIARNGDQMVFGSCESYSGNTISYTARAKVPPLCGNGIIEDNEVCDDGDAHTEGCGVENPAILDTAGTFCNSTCTGQVTAINELCDYNVWSNDCKTGGVWYTDSDVGDGGGPATFCNSTCNVEKDILNTACDGVGIG